MDNQMLARIEERLTAVGISAAEASRRAGLSKDAIRNLQRGRSTSMRGESLSRLAPVLETTPHWLLTGEDAPATPRHAPPAPAAHELPVFGQVAGAALGATLLSADPVETVPCPPGLARVRGAYALIVAGESMAPRWSTGDMVFVHPHRPPRPGDHIVVREKTAEGTRVTVKRFDTWTDRDLVTTQYNPDGEVRFRRDAVDAVHRVLTTNELFGI